MNAQEAFECVGESGYYLTVLFMERNQNSVIKLAAAFCFCLCVGKKKKKPNKKTHPKTSRWSYKEDSVPLMRTRAAETLRRMLPESRNLLRSLWDVPVWQSTTSHMCSSELKLTRWGLPQCPVFRGLCFVLLCVLAIL